MKQAKNGDTVKVHYTGKLKDGNVFDTSTNHAPLQFTIGDGQIIPGFEQAVIGMNPGESKTTNVSMDEAYGPHRKENLLEVNREHFPAHTEPKVGQQFQIPQQNGRKLIVTVADISESSITLDANHPLAGKDLTFDIELVEIL